MIFVCGLHNPLITLCFMPPRRFGAAQRNYHCLHRNLCSLTINDLCCYIAIAKKTVDYFLKPCNIFDQAQGGQWTPKMVQNNNSLKPSPKPVHKMTADNDSWANEAGCQAIQKCHKNKQEECCVVVSWNLLVPAAAEWIYGEAGSPALH